MKRREIPAICAADLETNNLLCTSRRFCRNVVLSRIKPAAKGETIKEFMCELLPDLVTVRIIEAEAARITLRSYTQRAEGCGGDSAYKCCMNEPGIML